MRRIRLQIKVIASPPANLFIANAVRELPALEIKFGSPPADVLAALRELAAGGLEIYIGNDKQNFIDSPSEKESDEGSQEESDEESQEESVEESEEEI
jgi:hypothetical protein